MRLTFICGCVTGEVISRDNLKTMDSVTYDEEGFLVCAIHHARRYGWRSIPAHQYQLASLPSLALEAMVVFGEDWSGSLVRV